MAFWERKSEEELERERARRDAEIEKATQERKNQEDMETKIRLLDRFPGSLEEYMALKKEERSLSGIEIIVPMSTGRPEKFILDPEYSNRDWNWGYGHANNITFETDKELLSKLLNEGCIGLIRYTRSYNDSSRRAWGIPVKIKVPEGPPYR